MPKPTKKPVTINGITYESQSEAARALHIHISTLRQRIMANRLPTENVKNMPIGGCDSVAEYSRISGIPKHRLFKFIYKFNGDIPRALQTLINIDVKKILARECKEIDHINGNGVDNIMYFRRKDNTVVAQYTMCQFRYKDKIYAIKIQELKILLAKTGCPLPKQYWRNKNRTETAAESVKKNETTANKLKCD